MMHVCACMYWGIGIVVRSHIQKLRSYGDPHISRWTECRGNFKARIIVKEGGISLK